MPTLHQRSLPFVAACCITLAALSNSVLQAQEFKPFLKIQTASPTVLINVAESVAAVVNPEGIAEMRAQMAPYKNMPGVSVTGTIGLAIQVNEDAPFGLDTIIVLPITNLMALNIPGMEEPILELKAMLGAPVRGKYTLLLPIGETAVFQKTGYVVLATEGAADYAENADPRTLFAELGGFTAGLTVDLENITMDDVEMIMEMLAFPLAMMGMDFDLEEIMEAFQEGSLETAGAGTLQQIVDTASITMGFTLDPRTLNLTASTLHTPRKDSELAKKFLNVKNAGTNFGGFLQDTPKTIFSFSILDYLTDAEIADLEMAVELVGEGFLQGLLEEVGDDEGGKFAVMLGNALLQRLGDLLAYYDTNRMIDAAVSFDSDGAFLFAWAIDTESIEELVEQLYSLLPLAGAEEGLGEQIQEHIDGKIKWGYETVAGYSLSGLPNLFADLPEEVASPEEIEVIQKIPFNLYWAIKKDEAVAFAIGLDAAKTEAAFKAALQATTASVQPNPAAVFALRPLGQFLQTHLLPLIEIFAADEPGGIAELTEAFAKFAAVDASAKITATVEFPNDAQFQKFQIDGKFFTAFIEVLMKPAVMAAREAARRMQCMNHMRMIGLAFHNYHDAHGAFPPLYTVDAEGKPLHSWRVLILPYIEQTAVYQMIRLDEPWDSVHNRQFHAFPIPTYLCPSNPVAGQLNCVYSVIAGEVFLPATAAGRNVGNGIATIQDGTSNTVAIVELKQPFCWMDPTADIDLAEFVKGVNKPDGKVGSSHPGGANVVLFDASGRFVTETIDLNILRALGTRAGGEILPAVW